MIPLVLASTSRYRHELLSRIVTGFNAVAPDVDESVQPGESPGELAVRLAADKARTVAVKHPGSVVLASDQVAELDGAALGKPGDHANAHRQLTRCAGREVIFHTAIHVCTPDGREASAVDRTRVRFRPLSPSEIDIYLHREQPYDCAGSFKSEGLGISLFEAIHSEDPTALIGLPLIATARLLRHAGLDPLTAS